MITTHTHDPVSLSKESDFDSGKEVLPFLTIDPHSGEEIEASCRYNWRMHKEIESDIEYEVTVIAYPDGFSKELVDQDADEAVQDELRRRFGSRRGLDKLS